MVNKLAIGTTFPNWLDYPKETIPTWLKNIPEDILLLIGLDPCQNLKNTESWIHPLVDDRCKKESCFISKQFSPEQIDFLKRNKAIDNNSDYRLDYRRFSFKVFFLYQALIFACENDIDYLVWIDADVSFKKNITVKDFEKWLPVDKVASYLGRKDWDHSECGFMIFNLKNGGKEFLERFYTMYVKDEVLTLSQWHDSFVFDCIRKEFNEANGRDVFLNISEGINGRDVFDDSSLSEFMEHKKGMRKFNDNSLIDLDNLKVQTKNCVDHDIIKANILENLKLITKWIYFVKPHSEQVVIANAGPSLDPEKIRPLYEKGIKVIAVKHALTKLLDAGITPWACILLDPREHVKDFVSHPKAKDINWFVASMVSPEVTKILIDQGCKIYGYHAYVGAEEEKILPIGSLLVSGGSATCTRGIDLLFQILGFKKFHLFGYDLCSLEKPDLSLKKGDKPIWMEVELSSDFGDKKIKRKFYTKGEFLAQVQELRNMFASKQFKVNVYGDAKTGGIIPWIFHSIKKKEKFLKVKNKPLFNKKISLNDFFN